MEDNAKRMRVKNQNDANDGMAWHGNSSDIQISNGRVSLKTAADLCGWHSFML